MACGQFAVSWVVCTYSRHLFAHARAASASTHCPSQHAQAAGRLVEEKRPELSAKPAPSSRLPGDEGGEQYPSQRGRLQREQLPAPALHGPVQPERRRLLGVRVHPRLLSYGACGAALRSVRLRRCSCPPQGRFRGLLDKHGRGRRSVGPLACGMLAAICRRKSSVPAKASAEPCNAAGFCLGFPNQPRCKASLLGLSADMLGRRCGARIREGPRGPASPPNCRRRADVARNSVGMSRVRRAAARPGQQPRGA